jgi:hypothetical protein
MTTNDVLGQGNEGYEFNPDAVNDIDPASVESNGPSFPMLQWNYGEYKNKKLGNDSMDYAGGWFVNGDNVDAATMIAAGWKPESWTHDNGTETSGFYSRSVAVSIIGMRRRWEVAENSSGNRVSFPWSKYDAALASASGKKPSGRLHVLVIVKGLESIGPMVLTLKGAASQAFNGSKNNPGVIGRFAQTVIAAANAASDAAAKKNGKPAGKKWPYRAFWLPVGAARDAEGTPVFEEFGSGNEKKKLCVPVALGLPAKAADVNLKRHYIGEDLLSTVNTLVVEYGEWMVAWDKMEAGTPEGNGAAAATNGTPEQAPPVTADLLAEAGL